MPCWLVTPCVPGTDGILTVTPETGLPLSVTLMENCTLVCVELVAVVDVTATVEVDRVDTTVTVAVAVNTPPNAAKRSTVERGVL